MSRTDAILVTLAFLLVAVVLVGLLIVSVMDYEEEFGSYTPQTDLNNAMDTWENPNDFHIPEGYQGPE